VLTAEVDGVTALKVISGQRRNRDAVGLEVLKGCPKPLKILRVGQD
jgi:hypothetical protein